MNLLWVPFLTVMVHAAALSPNQLRPGMSRDDVRQKAGEPAKELNAGLAHELWWYGDSRKSCMLEFFMGELKGEPRCGHPDLKIEDAEKIADSRSYYETEDFRKVQTQDRKLKAELQAQLESEQEDRMWKQVSVLLRCGPMPGPVPGCEIDRCENGKWIEVCHKP